MPKNGRAVSENLTDFQPFIHPFPISIISIPQIRELKFYLLKDFFPLKALFINWPQGSSYYYDFPRRRIRYPARLLYTTSEVNSNPMLSCFLHRIGIPLTALFYPVFITSVQALCAYKTNIRLYKCVVKCFKSPLNKGFTRVHILSISKTKVELKYD